MKEESEMDCSKARDEFAEYILKYSSIRDDKSRGTFEGTWAIMPQLPICVM